jgi:hypothetical protein
MSARWSALGPSGQAAAAARFAALDAGDRMDAGGPPGTARPCFAHLWAWATDPEQAFGPAEQAALDADPSLRADFALLLRRVAVLQAPAAAAAASGRLEARSGPGFRLRLARSRADPEQTYVVLELDAGAAPRLLVILQDGAPVARLALPEVVGGFAQVIVASDGPVAEALRDPRSELILT